MDGVCAGVGDGDGKTVRREGGKGGFGELGARNWELGNGDEVLAVGAGDEHRLFESPPSRTSFPAPLSVRKESSPCAGGRRRGSVGVEPEAAWRQVRGLPGPPEEWEVPDLTVLEGVELRETMEKLAWGAPGAYREAMRRAAKG